MICAMITIHNKNNDFSGIMNDVIRATIKAHNKGGPGKIEWRVLVNRKEKRNTN